MVNSGNATVVAEYFIIGVRLSFFRMSTANDTFRACFRDLLSIKCPLESPALRL
jgi:hypothetical protein